MRSGCERGDEMGSDGVNEKPAVFAGGGWPARGRTRPWSRISPISLTADGVQVIQEFLIAVEPPDPPGGQIRLGLLEPLVTLAARWHLAR